MRSSFKSPKGNRFNGNITIRLDPGLKKRLDSYCQDHYHARISPVVSAAIEQFLENEGWKDSDV